MLSIDVNAVIEFDSKSFCQTHIKIMLNDQLLHAWCRHEIVGVVTEVGSKVEKFKVGHKVGVGCMVGSCRSCNHCTNSLENYCPKSILTYGVKYYDGTTTYGGYSDIMVADEHFVIRIPDNLPLDACAPLLCAGITVYSPLRFYGLDKPGMQLGVVGLGGLGHVAVKFAKAMGMKVTVISTSPKKKKEALENLGADSFLVSSDQDEMQVHITVANNVTITKTIFVVDVNWFLTSSINFYRLPGENWMESLIRCLQCTLSCLYLAS